VHACSIHVGVHECVKKQALITPAPTLKNTYVYVLHFTVLLKTHTYTFCTSLSSSKHIRIRTALHCPPQKTYEYTLHFTVLLKTHTQTNCTSLSSSKDIRIRTALHCPPQNNFIELVYVRARARKILQPAVNNYMYAARCCRSAKALLVFV
jgi:hypothetical protein